MDLFIALWEYSKSRMFYENYKENYIGQVLLPVERHILIYKNTGSITSKMTKGSTDQKSVLCSHGNPALTAARAGTQSMTAKGAADQAQREA